MFSGYAVESYVTVNESLEKYVTEKITKITFESVQSSGGTALYVLVYTDRECLLTPSLVQSKISD
jgi:hypothetical protein